jgi:peptidoglycan/xylan/chitin deacetylase (PgdA/CDA1 family)
MTRFVTDHSGSSCRRWVLRAVALAAVCMVWVPGAAASGWHRGGTVGAVRVVRLRLLQLGTQLVLDVQFAPAPTRRALSAPAGRGLCLFIIASHVERHRACVVRQRRIWQVTVDRVRQSDALVHWAGSSLRLRLPLALATGTVEWAVRLREGDCRSGCVRRLPARGRWTVRVVQLPPPTCARRAAARGEGPEVALTFDDGPSAYTPALLAELETLRAPATFFLVGRQVAGSQALLQRMLADGDALGNHTWDHVDVSHGGPDAAAELERTNAAIAAATGGYRPCLFRPPYGSTGPRLEALARSLGMQTVLWTVDPRDWSRPGTATIVTRVLTAVQPRAIVVLHDGGGPREQTVAAVPAIIRGLRARGYRLVTVPASPP